MTEEPGDVVTPLDTIDFERLVELGRALIPRSAPDWTDHNLHDPGMTLLDLLAWIVDQQVYRTGLVGGRHRQAFAALLGRRPEGPRPAVGVVWPHRRLPAGRLLAAGAELRCDAHSTVGFVVAREVFFTSAALVRGRVGVDGAELAAPSADLDGVAWRLGDARRGATALTLGFDAPLGRPTEPAPVALAFDVAAPPGAPPSADHPWGPVTFEYRVGDRGPWARLAVEHDGTAGMALGGHVVLRIPPARGRPDDGSELRLAFDRGFFPVPPRVRAVCVNAVPVVQVEHVAPAPIGHPGTGLPDQSVELDTTGLVAPLTGDGAALRVTVDGEPWHPRSGLASSGPGDPHYVVHPDHLLFGNGVNGRRPALGASIEHTGLTRTVGTAGNLRAGLSWTIPALEAAGIGYGVNRSALHGGSDATPPEELVVAAREAATRHAALMTDEDVMAAAYDLPGMAVGRAEVIARFDRRLPGQPVDGVRTLVVAPHAVAAGPGDDRVTGAVAVPADYLRAVRRRLEPRRVLGERLVVQGPTVVPVDVWVTVAPHPWADEADTRAAVETALRDRLAVVRRAAAADPWPLGRDVTVLEVMSVTAGVPGVAAVPRVRIAAAGTPPGDDPVPVPRDGVAVARRVEVAAGEDAGHPAGVTGPGRGRWG